MCEGVACSCGCGGPVAPGRRFIRGHNPSTVAPAASAQHLKALLAELGNKTDVASALGITAKSVLRLIRRYGIENPAYVQSASTRASRSLAIHATLAQRPISKHRQLDGLRRHHERLRGSSIDQVYAADVAAGLRARARANASGRTQSAETREKKRAAMLGRKMSASARVALSLGRKEAFATGRLTLSPRAGCGNGGFKDDIGHYVRSSYEWTLASWLQKHNIDYRYEPRRFALIVGGLRTGYTPDFRIGRTWVEVKNAFNATTPRFAAVREAFREQHPDERLIIVVGDRRWERSSLDDQVDDSLMAAQTDLVEVVHELKQILCVKG